VPDRCPGVLAVHEAADGGLARVRLPGGVLSASQLRVLAAAAVELGDGHLELTSRANVQIRALQPGAPVELSERLHAAGLLPSITQERVRNILASPLSGLDHDSRYDVLPLAGELDRLLCATPSLAALPGRFLFALDDGRGDLAPSKADVAVQMIDGAHGELLLAGVRTGVLLEAEQVPGVMVAAAGAFLAERAAQESEGWRLAELRDGPRFVRQRLGLEAEAAVLPTVSSGTPVAGAFAGPRGGGVVVTVPLGVLGAEQAEALAEAGSQLRVTPWRSVVVPGGQGAVEKLQEVGLVLEADSAWNGVTSCAGRPGCGKALGDVRGDARRVVPGWSGGGPVHWSGCERRCGKPGGEFVDVVALAGGGYAVDGVAMGVDEVRAQ
jgi:precorrin-3B synthase